MNAEQILIADEEAWVREHCGQALTGRGFDVETVSNGHGLLGWLDRQRRRDHGKRFSVDLDLLILGCNVLLEQGGEYVGPIRARVGSSAANTPVLIVTTYACRRICFRGWRLPIVGTMTKPFKSDTLADRVSALLADGRPSLVDGADGPEPLRSLTDREQTVLSLLCHGLRDQEIGNCLDISVQTVHTHVKRVIDKLGVRNRTEAAAIKSAFEGGHPAPKPN